MCSHVTPTSSSKEIRVDTDREDATESFPFHPQGPCLILSLIIWFQGSEWNAANFEELHKNKSVLYLCVVMQYTCLSASVR